MKVCLLGENVLREKAETVQDINDDIRALVNEMFDVMVNDNGVGLAGPQVGKRIRLFVIMVDDNVRRVFINPQIMATSEEMVDYDEGCLSIPGIWETIKRPARVTVQAYDENGKRFVLEAEGLLARAIQHENDHLDGILFIDHGDPSVAKKAQETFKKRAERAAKKAAEKAAKKRSIAAKIAAKNAAKNK